MRISFSPQRRDDALTVVKTGDVLTVNGDTLDLSMLPDGATVTDPNAVHPMLTKIERVDGQLHVGLFLPHGPNPPDAVAFPADLIDPPDGDIPLPEA